VTGPEELRADRSSSTVEAVLASILDRLEEDAGFDPREWIARHPEHANEIESRLNLLRAAGLLAPARSVGVSERSVSALGTPVRLREIGLAPYLERAEVVIPAGPVAGRYRLTESLGAGGMGTVYRAVDLKLGREVAVKIARNDLPDGGRVLLARFLREAQITSQLDHPGIVSVHDTGTTEDHRPFYAMDLVRGRSLHELVAEAERGIPGADTLPIARCIEIVRRICEAVAYAHARGVVHRDLKPSNVMVGAFGEVLVMDWGLARVLDDPAQPASPSFGRDGVRHPEPAATQEGHLLGSPAFAAPEQARGERDRIDERTDVFGIGAVLHFLLTGRPLYSGSSQREVEELARQGSPSDPDLRSARLRVPGEIRGIVRKATAREPAARYARVQELDADLRAAVESRPGSAWKSSMPSRLVKWTRRHPTAAVSILLAAILFAISIFAGSVWMRLHTAREQQRRDSLVRLLDFFRVGKAIHGGPSGGDRPEMLRRNFSELASLGWSLDDDPDRWIERMRGLAQTDPVLHRQLLDGLYEGTADLYLDGPGPAADAADFGEKLSPSHRLLLAPERWKHSQDLQSHWRRLVRILKEAEPDPWRAHVWSVSRRWWEPGRGPELEAWIEPEILERRSGEELEWLAVMIGVFLNPDPVASRATAIHRMAVERNPGLITSHNNLGLDALDRQDLVSARVHFTAVVALRPDSSSGWSNLGIVHGRLATTHRDRGEEDLLEMAFREAGVCYETSIRVNPRNAFPYGNWASLLRDHGESEASLDVLARGLEPLRGQKGLYMQLSRTLDELARRDPRGPWSSLALDAAHQAVVLDPRDGEAWLDLAREQARLGQLAAAGTSARIASLSPRIKEPAILEALGTAKDVFCGPEFRASAAR